MVAGPDGRSIYMFGGVTPGGSNSDEMIKLDVDTGSWHRDFSIGTRPSARIFHTMAAVGSDIYIFGGVADSGESG
jgi:hypothetical protein